MDKTEAVIETTAKLDGIDNDSEQEKPISKRQRKLQKRRKEWLMRKADMRWLVIIWLCFVMMYSLWTSDDLHVLEFNTIISNSNREML